MQETYNRNINTIDKLGQPGELNTEVYTSNACIEQTVQEANTLPVKTKYNKTQLTPEVAFERHVYHRDQFAHFLRWTHILKKAKIGDNILDWGCGITASLAEVLYRNRFKADNYIGLDIRDLSLAREKFKNVPWVKLYEKDLVLDDFTAIANSLRGSLNTITSFEVIEHIGKHNADRFLQNVKMFMDEKTTFYLSTPVYDEKVGPANNHIIDGQVGEFGYDELETLLNKYFTIEKVYGTFASQSSYKPVMEDWQVKMFDKLSEYYDSNLVSVLMAPMFPRQARNCMWVLKYKA